MFTKRSKTRISQKTCRTFSIVMIMTLHGHVQSVWSTSTCQEARALGQRLWFSTPWETMSFAQELMFTANRIENNHDSKIVLALKNNCTCFKHVLCQPRKTRLQERQKKTHRVSSNKKRPSDDIAELTLKNISMQNYATLEPHRQDCTSGRGQSSIEESPVWR